VMVSRRRGHGNVGRRNRFRSVIGKPIKPVEATAFSQGVKTAAISKPASARTAAANAKRRGAGERARQLLRAQLSDGPKAGAEIEAAAAAAEISERSLIRATDVLGVRCRQGQWWLPG
jgi:hypothetical protein